MWVFIEKVGELYVGVAHDDDGHQLLDIAEPVTESEIRARMAPLSDRGHDDIDAALDEAAKRPDDGRTPERKLFHLIKVRAVAGLASQSDAAWVVEQLRDRNLIHSRPLLIWTLGYMGPEYEPVIAPLLTREDPGGETVMAMHALHQMGLLEDYVDLFLEWMRGEYQGRGNASHSLAAHAFFLTQSPRILRALIDASNDTDEKWNTRQHARYCLAQAVDVENAPMGLRMPAQDPYYASVLTQAQTLLFALEAKERGETFTPPPSLAG
jgi:hypothetical protein